MKRFFAFSMCLILVSFLTGCNSTNLKSGYYYKIGNYEEYATPYVELNFDDNSFTFGEGLILSYAERGSFAIKGEKITATTQNTTFVFEIKDSASIILIDCGEYEALTEHEGAEFGYHGNV